MKRNRKYLNDLTGKTAVITGAGEGIGRGIACALSEQGAKVVLVGIHQENIEQLAAALTANGREAFAYQADVSQLSQMESLADTILSRYGEVNLLCNNAGIAYPCEFSHIVIEDWQHIFNVNLWGVLHGIKIFLPIMEQQGKGHIVTTASEAGLYSPGPSFLAPYNISKHAVVGLMTSLEGDLKARNSPITASIFCPSTTNTKATEIRDDSAMLSYHFSTMSQEASDFWGAVSCALQEKGISLEASANHFVDGLKRGDFWIFSHSHVAETHFNQAKLMLEELALLDIGLNEN